MDKPISEEGAKRHYEWRNRVARHLPKLAARVFALRDKAYRGCGFHYALEAELGYVIARMNDHANPIGLAGSVIERVRLRQFLRTLLRAEFSARGWDFPDKNEQISG